MYHFKEIPDEEIELRCKRAINLMGKYDVDCMIISDTKNFRYFTGCESLTKNRPSYFILPIEGNPFIITADFTANLLKKMSPFSDVLEYNVPIDAQKLFTILTERKINKMTIGTEIKDSLFGGFRMNLQFGEFLELKRLMNNSNFVDASDILWHLRAIKSDLEIKYIKEACNITGKAYNYMFNLIHPGMTEIDVSKMIIEGMLKNGADHPSLGKNGPCSFILCDSSRPLGEPHIPVEKSLNNGDILHIDTGAVFHGYQADFARLGVVGKPNKRQKDFWEKCFKGIVESLEKIKSGNCFKDLTVHWHGIGLDGVEYPFIGMNSDVLMETGMTIAIENFMYSNFGESFHLEQNVLITDDGYQLLSPTDLGFFEIN